MSDTTSGPPDNPNAATVPTPSTVEPVPDAFGIALAGVAEIVMLIASGNYVGAGKRAAELAIDLVPPELLREHLTAKGVQLANEAADALEREKFGP